MGDKPKCPICGKELISQHAGFGLCLDPPLYDWECKECWYECDSDDLEENKEQHQKQYNRRIQNKINSWHLYIMQDLRNVTKAFQAYDEACEKKRKWGSEDG